MRVHTFGALFSMTLLLSCSDPVTTTLAIGGAGLTTGKLLDRMSDRVNFSIGQAASAGSLAADAAARNLLLVLENARTSLDTDLDKRWDRLDREKIDGLRALDQAVANVDRFGQRIQDVQELTFLDAGGLLDKLPFVDRAYAIKRIDGATQYFKQSGSYRLLIRGNPFVLDGRPVSISIGGRRLPKDALASEHDFEIEALVPTEMLVFGFQDRKLGVAPLRIEVDVPTKAAWYLPWKKAGTRHISFDVPIRLLPRFPIEYSFEAYSSKPVIDRSVVMWMPSRVVVAGGCGKSGCYAYHNVYADLPAGTEATGKVRNCTDTFSGWGMFVRQNGFINFPFLKPNTIPKYEEACGPGMKEADAIKAEGTSVLMVYQQHSHSTTRNVQYEAGYHPLKQESVVKQIGLVPLILADTAPAGTAVGDEPKHSLPPASLIMSFAKLGSIASFPVPSTLHDARSDDAPPLSTRPVKRGYLQYGQSYEAQLSPGAHGWTLRARTFLGDDVVVTEQKIDARIDAVSNEQTNFSRVVVTPKVPF